MNIIELPILKCDENAVLAIDVINDKGTVLLKSGAILTAAKLNSLVKNGIETISIVNENKMTEAQLAEKKKKVEKIIKRLFRKSNMQPHMKQLQGIFVDYYVNRGEYGSKN